MQNVLISALTSPTRHTYRTKDVLSLLMDDEEVPMDTDSRDGEIMSYTSESSRATKKLPLTPSNKLNKLVSARKRKNLDDEDDADVQTPSKRSRRDVKTPNKVEPAPKTPKSSKKDPPKTPKSSKKDPPKTPKSTKREDAKTPKSVKKETAKTPKSVKKETAKTPRSTKSAQSVATPKSSRAASTKKDAAGEGETPKRSGRTPGGGVTPQGGSARRRLQPEGTRRSSLRMEVFTADESGNVSTKEVAYAKSSRGRNR